MECYLLFAIVIFCSYDESVLAYKEIIISVENKFISKFFLRRLLIELRKFINSRFHRYIYNTAAKLDTRILLK